MAWIAEDRRAAAVEKPEKPYLSEEMKAHVARTYFPRYPTRRAALLPLLHEIQHVYGWIPPAAMEEAAAFLEISPAEVLDTASFYEEYWLRPKGRYLVQVCRSLACDICGSKSLTEHLKRKLGIEPGETTTDGKFTLVELECLGSCGTAPAVLINDVLLEDLTPQKLDAALDALGDDPKQFKDPTVAWESSGGH